MAMTIDQKQKLLLQQQGQHKHYCRICKKGFSCGRALGGHMRAHGISDEPILDPEEYPPTVRTNPNRHRSTRVCENCCCSSAAAAGDPEGLSPPSSPRSCSKGKRSRRSGKPNSSSPDPPHSPTEEEDLANCLVMLSAARVDPVLCICDAEESSASASKDADDVTLPPPPTHPKSGTLTPRGMFECKACKKVFTSHQALGGHRASHKKVKGCFAARLEIEGGTAPIEDENNNNIEHNNNDNNQIGSSSGNAELSIVPFVENSPQPKKKAKVHECSICHRQFASGQALGGHKRCHWMTSNSAGGAVEPVTVAARKLRVGCSSSGVVIHSHSLTLRQMYNSSDRSIDLNMPAPMDDLTGIPLRLEMPTAIYIKPEWDIEKKRKQNEEEEEGSNGNLDDEAESKVVKLAKLSDLKDMNEGEESSQWLQVGIGSMDNKESSADRS